MSTSHSAVDEYLSKLPQWQAEKLSDFRALVHEADADITEEIKWNVPVFMYKNRGLFAMSAFKAHVKYNFLLNGALIDDTDSLFNNGLESKKSRGIDVLEAQSVDLEALRRLIGRAIEATS